MSKYHFRSSAVAVVPSDVRVVDVVALLIRLYGSLDPCVFASAERSGLSISRSREDNGNSPPPYGVQRRQRLSLSLSLSLSLDAASGLRNRHFSRALPRTSITSFAVTGWSFSAAREINGRCGTPGGDIIFDVIGSR